jgi:hypothetical protein
MRSNGRHVVLEFLLASPGDRLRSEAKSWPKLEPVLPPETWGISTEPDQYSSVTADNYASAAAAYGLALPPPPPATAVVRAELASSSPSARLPIPPGYQANAVSISYVVSDATQVISAVVGTMPVTFSPTPMPAATSQSPATLSAAAVPSGPPAIPDPQGYGWTTPAAGVGTGSVTLPAQTTGEFPLACQYGGASFNLIVEAQCTAAGPAALTAWQVATHQKIITGYDQARVARDAAVMSAIVAVQASEGVGRLISRQLTLSALDALGKALPEPAGSTPAPDAQRFLTDALAWQQSTYAFYPSAVGTARRPSPVRWIGETVTDRNDPAWLRSFMQAASARMLVTVRRGYEVPLLFLLAFGYLPEPSRGVFTTAHGRLWLDQLLADDRNEPEECWHLYIPTEQAALVVNDAFGRSVRP